MRIKKTKHLKKNVKKLQNILCEKENTIEISVYFYLQMCIQMQN